MMLSLFLAKLIGLYLVLISGAMLLNRRDISLLFGIYTKNPKAIYMTGIVDTFAGLAIVLSHNIWAWDFRGVITFVGWMLLLRGAGRLLAPDMVAKSLTRFKKMGQGAMLVMLICVFLVGLYLAYMGFTLS